MKLVTIFIFLTVAVYAIVPPKEGRFPDGVLETMKNQGIGENYGDPGWIKKIARLRLQGERNIQSEFNLPVLLGKYSGAQNY